MKLKDLSSHFIEWTKTHPFRVVFLVALGAIIGWQISLVPTTEKNWRAENLFFPEVLLEEDMFTVSFLRDFYSEKTGEDEKNTEISEHWKVNTYHYSDLTEVSLGLSHFADFYGAAHTFLHFEFADGNNLNISFEARLEENEGYSPWKGLARQNELYISVATDRDIIGERVNRKQEKVFLYPLNISPEKQKEVLLTALNRTNTVQKNPEFYNTLTDNCTTSLVAIAEEVKDQNILWGYSHLVPGYFDEKLFHMGLLKNPENFSPEEFSQFKNQHFITEF